jgi:uncharacterized damage-inducible protein DinB
MSVKAWLLPEYDHEMALTREVLVRLPEGAFEWRPHERAFSLGSLANHLAILPRWGLAILERDAYDLNTSEEPREIGSMPHDVPGPDLQVRQTGEDGSTTSAAVLESFDRHAAALRRALVERADAELTARWALVRGDRVLMTMPRHAAIRRFLLNHTVHHRGQLTVYLRMQNAPVPPLYGSSADERL